MSSIAVSYGEKGSVFCGLKSDGSHTVTCYGSNSAIIYETPTHFSFLGLTAGDGFVCGLLMDSNQPYCWGNSGYIEMGVPQPMIKKAQYLEISAGDYHVCGLRKPWKVENVSLVDCWGYNMTKSYMFDGMIQSISAGSVFNCGLFSNNRSVFCWGDETSSKVISLTPLKMKFKMISAGGYHVCGILEGVNSRTFCWGRSLDIEEQISVTHVGQGNVDLAPNDPMISIVGGRFHACGIKSYDNGVICWGFMIKSSTLAPSEIKVYEIAGGDYFTCGVLAGKKSLVPFCWGVGFPTSLPLAVLPGICKPFPCSHGFYEFDQKGLCKFPNSGLCMPCSGECPIEMYQKSACNLASDRVCEYNCSACSSHECFLHCSSSYSNVGNEKKNEKIWALQLPVLIAEIGFVLFIVSIASLTSVLYVRHRLRDCECSARLKNAKKLNRSSSLHQNENRKIRPEMEELKLRKAQRFTYEELETATSGFKEESIVGKGSFSCVFKGVLKDGTVVAVKRAIIANVACKCVRMRGKERPSMDKVTTSLERSLAVLMGSPCIDQPILPSEVVLGSNRMHRKSSQMSSNRSVSETEDQRFELRAPSWITFPSVASSLRRKSSMSEADVDGKIAEMKINIGNVGGSSDMLRSLEEEIGPASPQERLFLEHNF
ncbi:hypothetical protein TSUD_88750 [Trifolium subterraneum]|uniref:non-specific serine/threonine protein kinase n=1 Tax=Trifolium subterraneum TaxID=3900 RepID=A0A2Z6P5Y4_TRISU|nr:hypothetical protein TSUD_88750 [Trifolium subterraneum]